MRSDGRQTTPDGEHWHTVNTHSSGLAQLTYRQNQIRQSDTAGDERGRTHAVRSRTSAVSSGVTDGRRSSLGGHTRTHASKMGVQLISIQRSLARGR